MEKNLKSTHEGQIHIGELTLDVAVLKGGKRVIKQVSVFKALGRPQRGNSRLPGIPVFMDSKNLQRFITEPLMNVIQKIEFIDKNGKRQEGYDASILPLVADLFLRAREANVMTRIHQIQNAQKAEILVRSLARVGIIAMVDEATGYQDLRMKDALQQILDQFLLEEAKKYVVTFPLELYKQWFRLNNWDWKPENARKRPGVIGTWTNKYIYSRLAPNLLSNLETRNPKNSKGYRNHKHFQLLSDDIGEPKLREFFGGLIALARATNSWKKYTELVERAYPAFGDQYKIDLDGSEDNI